MRRKQYCRARLGGLTNQFQNDLPDERVKSDCRLVQNEHLRLVLKSVKDTHFLTITLRKSAHASIKVQVEPLGQFILPLAYVFAVA